MIIALNIFANNKAKSVIAISYTVFSLKLFGWGKYKEIMYFGVYKNLLATKPKEF